MKQISFDCMCGFNKLILYWTSRYGKNGFQMELKKDISTINSVRSHAINGTNNQTCFKYSDLPSQP